MAMNNKIELKKKYLVLNIIGFLQDELIHTGMSEDKKESVEVAIQCLESAFDLENDLGVRISRERVNLLALIPMRTEVSDEQKIQAEECKNKGNEFMKTGEYIEALEQYNKAIEINPNNAVYFCNRAAAYSRMEKHLSAIADCKAAIKLEPSYGKAYGRLGIAYSNLNKYEDARTAYLSALKYDPGNQMYETNLKLAEEKLYSAMESAAPPEHRPLDISQFINNPHLIRMATEMLSNSNFRNLVSGIMSSNTSDQSEANLDALFQAGELLANRMQTSDPNFVENLRRSLGGGGGAAAAAAAAAAATATAAQATTSSAEETSPEPSNEGDNSPEL